MYRDSEGPPRNGGETSVPGAKSVRQGEAANDRNRWVRRGVQS